MARGEYSPYFQLKQLSHACQNHHRNLLRHPYFSWFRTLQSTPPESFYHHGYRPIPCDDSLYHGLSLVLSLYAFCQFPDADSRVV